MVINTLKNVTAGRKPILLLFALLFVSIYLMSVATQNSLLFGELYSSLLIVNLLALLLLVALIGRHLLKLIVQYRRREAGSRLTARLVVIFITLAVAPSAVLYYFSMQFLHRGIDSWFDLRVDMALENALELGRVSLEGRIKEQLRQTRITASEVGASKGDALAKELDKLRLHSEASELALLTLDGRVMASSSNDVAQAVQNLPGDGIVQQIRQGLDYAALEPLEERGFTIRVAVMVSPHGALAEPLILHALYPIAERQGALAESVQAAYTRYRELVYLRRPLKQSFSLTLSLVLLLSLLTAVWGAFFSARRLVSPLRDLAEGTQALAAGDYGTRLPVPSRDEVGFLVRSFNEMAQRIDHARNAATRSQELVESQRAYLEAVLRRLSSGVLTLDKSGVILTANQAALQILHQPMEALTGRTMQELMEEQPVLQPLTNAIAQQLIEVGGEWRSEVTLFGSSGRQVIICRGTPLSAPNDAALEGHVIVFDDITALIQAQRDAAWGEVARRLAHEIKNPLTPIQLSAERLRHKYLHTMSPEESDVLDRATHTIVQQVETMKTMVKAFSDYARPPKLHLETIDLYALIQEVVDLYQGTPDIQFSLHLAHEVPLIQADRLRLRQLLHNLIKNGQEAVGNHRTAAITISLHALLHHEECHAVEMVLSDNGPGIPEELMGQLFEPYVTTKPKGSGLGLAIVKKIVEEHGGRLTIENSQTGGASVTVVIPCVQEGGGRLETEAALATKQQ